jgi:hypothetical protein
MTKHSITRVSLKISKVRVGASLCENAGTFG